MAKTDPADKPAVLSGAMGLHDRADAARRAMCDEATRLLAAITLAREDFPRQDDLPRLASVPYSHLGHHVLMDYKRLAMILWGTTDEIQRALRESPRRYLAMLADLPLTLLLVLLGWWLLRTAEAPGPGVFMMMSALLAGFVAYRLLRPNAAKIAAEIRAKNMDLLLKGQVPSSAERYEKELAGHEHPLVEWGEAELEEDRSPVLVMLNNTSPFPGFGFHQARELFTCRPADETSPPELSPEALNEAVSDTLFRVARNSGIPSVSSGYVVLIDGKTLHKDSPWLRVAGRTGERSVAPPLFLANDHVSDVRAIDPDASVRAYSCIQAMVPEYLMCLTFFVRTFLAGNSAACEVNVSTLGPPRFDWNYIRSRLLVHDRERRKKDRPDRRRLGLKRLKTTPLGSSFEQTRGVLEASAPFQGQVNASDVLAVEPFNAEDLANENKLVDVIAENSQFWPGYNTMLVNWRECHSVTFTTDFFGNTESRALLGTLYDRICRSALCRLKELGFDISDYQNESGKFAIHADAIEQLVVGEQVYMERKPSESGDGARAGRKETVGGEPRTTGRGIGTKEAAA
jgi:hypothetical protein